MRLWFWESLINDTKVAQNNYCPRYGRRRLELQCSRKETSGAAALLELQACHFLQSPPGGGPCRDLEGTYALTSPRLCPAKAVKASASEMTGEAEPGTPRGAACLIDVMAPEGRCSRLFGAWAHTCPHTRLCVSVLSFRKNTKPKGFMEASELGEFPAFI